MQENTPLSIRPEQPADRDAVYALVRDAFATARVSDGDEQDYYLRLIASPGFVPELALVAERGGALVGHILLSLSAVTGEAGAEVLVLAPLSVAPTQQGCGVGAALVRAALDKACALGYRAVFLAGDPGYYGRFGFVPVRHFGIDPPGFVPADLADNILARELCPGALDGVRGSVVFFR